MRCGTDASSAGSSSLAGVRGSFVERAKAYRTPRLRALGSGLARWNFRDVEAERPFAAVGEPPLQRERDGAECDVLPGHLRLFEQRDLERLGARAELEIDDPRTEEHMHLVDSRNRDHRKRLGH